jgi:hypothetical protein
VAVALLAAALLLLPATQPEGSPATSARAGPRGAPSPSPIPAVVPRVGALSAVAPAAGGASARMIVSTADPASVPNDGITTNLTAFPTATFPPSSSFQTGAEEVIGGYEGVFGLFTNDQRAPTAFYAIFSNTTDQTVRLEYWVALPVVEGVAYHFSLVRSNGTTWTLTVNGQLFGDNATTATFDYGALTATWLGGLGFSEVAIYASSTTVPRSYDASTAFAVHLPTSGWYLPRNGTVNYTGPVGASWGVEGRVELSQLAPGEVRSGTSLAPIRNTSVLWSTGALPVSVTATATAPTVLGLGVVGVGVNVTTLSGAPIAGVPVYVGDSLGGFTNPATVVTGGDGSAATLLAAPNVTATSTDVIRATVSILGYSGSASVSVTVTPAVEIVVTASSARIAVAPGSTSQLAFQTSDPSGHPYPAVALVLTSVYAGNLSGVSGAAGLVVQPTAGTSDPNGTFVATLLAPPTSGEYAVQAAVTSLGAWGHASVNVSVRPPPPSFWAQYGSSRIVPLVGAAIVVALLAVVVLWVRRRRGKRQPLPEMDLRRLRQAPEAPMGTPSSGGPPVSRTPPGSSTP